jgi:excisionase family DNA binding protein
MPKDKECATLNVEQMARMMGLGRAAAYAGVRDKSIPSIRVGRRILIPKARLLAMLGERQ